jgi:hypothetical protein
LRRNFSQVVGTLLPEGQPRRRVGVAQALAFTFIGMLAGRQRRIIDRTAPFQRFFKLALRFPGRTKALFWGQSHRFRDSTELLKNKGNVCFHPSAKAEGFPAPEVYKLLIRNVL